MRGTKPRIDFNLQIGPYPKDRLWDDPVVAKQVAVKPIEKVEPRDIGRMDFWQDIIVSCGGRGKDWQRTTLRNWKGYVADVTDRLTPVQMNCVGVTIADTGTTM